MSEASPRSVAMATSGPYRNCTLLQMLENDTVNCLQVSSSTEPYWIIHAVLYAIVMMIGLSGNTLVIYVILRYSKMQTVTNFYIFNLALADEIYLISITFVLTTMALGRWPFGMVVCKIYWTITSINQFTSSLFLTVMSADRYLAVCHPISSTRWRTPIVSKIVCLTAWTVSSLMVVPLFMYAAEYEGKCNIYWPDSIGGEKAFTLYTFVLSFAVPVVLILIFYIFVINKLRHVGPKNRSRERKKSHRKVTRLVLTVITVYFFCYLPFWVTQLSMMLSQESHVDHSPVMVCVILLVYILTYFNSALNPILYAFLSDNFKKSFVKACQCARLPDVNNVLQVENSVFPRRSGGKMTEQREMDERGPSADPSTGLTGFGGLATSRSYNRVSLAETSNGHLTLKVPVTG